MALNCPLVEFYLYFRIFYIVKMLMVDCVHPHQLTCFSVIIGKVSVYGELK